MSGFGVYLTTQPSQAASVCSPPPAQSFTSTLCCHGTEQSHHAKSPDRTRKVCDPTAAKIFSVPQVHMSQKTDGGSQDLVREGLQGHLSRLPLLLAVNNGQTELSEELWTGGLQVIPTKQILDSQQCRQCSEETVLRVALPDSNRQDCPFSSAQPFAHSPAGFARSCVSQRYLAAAIQVSRACLCNNAGAAGNPLQALASQAQKARGRRGNTR